MALSGATVLDLSTMVAGPYCAKLLADFGARAIKIEPPSGDPARRYGPFPGDLPHAEKSGFFLLLNTNKLGITLNLDCATGRRILLELARDADIVVESFPPGYLAERGLDYEALSQANPRLVLTSVTPFGQFGPYSQYRATDITLYAMGGEMFSTGLPDREPLNLAMYAVLYHGGLHAALASVAALCLAQETGRGQQVDLSLMEVLSSNADRRTTALVSYQFTGENSQRTTMGIRGFPMGIYPCQDGYVHLWGLGRWPQAVAMMEMPEILEDPRFLPQAQAIPGHREAFDEIFLPWCLSRTRRQIWEAGIKAELLCAPLSTTQDILAEPHFQERGAWARADHPALGRVTVPGRPFIMQETPWRLCRPAPLLGQHNCEVLGPLGYSRQDLVILREAGAI